MFYSDNDNMLPFQLVSTGLIMPKTKQPTHKLAQKIRVLCLFSCYGFPHTLLRVMQSLVEIKITDLITLLCKSGTTNDTATF